MFVCFVPNHIMIRKPTNPNSLYMNKNVDKLTMKTAVTVLQEMMVKLGQIPEYDCVTQDGPQHLATFECSCKALGAVAKATARSKKEAKQEAARLLLAKLARRGDPVPPPYNDVPPETTQTTRTDGAATAETPVVGPRSYVALLKDLSEEYRLPGVEYELVGDTGPPHLRRFTVRARVGQHERLATASTKKAARQIAAEQLYTYMRENLARVTKDFVEEEALVRAHERAMERYVELRDAEAAWRPDLGQRIADYHLGLKTHIDPAKREMARSIISTLEATGSDECEVLEAALEAAAAALGLGLTRGALPGDGAAPLHVLELAHSSPALAFAGRDKKAAIKSALRYLKLAL